VDCGAPGVWRNVQAIRQMLADLRATAVQNLSRIGPTSGNADTIQTRIAEIRFRAIPIGSELAAVEALLAAAEESPQFKKAEAEWAPLVRAAEQKERKDEETRIARQRAEVQLNQARESSWRAALEKAEESPAIKKAERELAEAKAAEAEL
jgi:hypothetical protein